MHIPGLLNLLKNLPAYRALLTETPSEPQALLTSARAYVVAGLRQHSDRPLILLTARSEMANQLVAQLESWLPAPEDGGPPVYLFSEPDALPYERIPWSGITRQRRMTTLAALQSRSGVPPIVVASARALMQKTLPPKELRMALRPIHVGGIVRLEQMAVNWAQTGYNPAEVVEEPGSFARRGGIVDIWPPNMPHPVRIDLFGDEVDSLRIFDPATQRTLRSVNSVEIGPGGEALSKYGPAILTRLGIQGTTLNAPENLSGGADASPLQDSNLILAIREELRLEVERLSQGQSFHGIEWYLPYVYDKPASLLDYALDETRDGAQGGATLVIDDAAELMATVADLEAQAESQREELERGGELPRHFAPNYFGVEELRQHLLDAAPLLLGFGDLYGKSAAANTELARSFVPGPRYGGKTKEIAA